jgi:hypothetical protein
VSVGEGSPGVGVAVGVGVSVTVGVPLAVGVSLAVEVGVADGVEVVAAVGVGVACTTFSVTPVALYVTPNTEPLPISVPLTPAKVPAREAQLTTWKESPPLGA